MPRHRSKTHPSHAIAKSALLLLVLPFAALFSATAAAQTEAPPDLTSVQQLTATSAESAAASAPLFFGNAIALDGDTALVGMSGYRSNNGRVAVFGKSASRRWVRTGSLDAATPVAYEGFGLQVALSGDYALVTSTVNNYLFEKVRGQWTQVDKLATVGFGNFSQAIEPPYVFIGNEIYRIGADNKLRLTQTLVSDNPNLDGFGGADVVSHGTLVVAAAADNESRGTLYVYEERDGVWTLRQKLVADDPAPNDNLGVGLAISGDIIVAGATGKDYNYVNPDCNDQPTSGDVYVFTRTRGVWSETQKIDNPCVNYFGGQITVSHDWFASSYPDFAFGTQLPGAIVYQRDGTREPEVSFVPHGTVSLTNAGSSTVEVNGSTLFEGDADGRAPEATSGDVHVFRLARPQ